MSYIFNDSVQYKDNSNIDAFGRLRVSETSSLLEIKHLYDKLPYIVDEEIIGSATSSLSNSVVNMVVNSTNDAVIRQSIKSSQYQTGKSQLVEASFDKFDVESDVIKRVGYFTSATSAPYNSGFDGFFLESNGNNSEISFQIWKNGSQIYSANESDWLTNDLDVSLINWSYSQLMMCDFQWLGVGRIRFYLVHEGVPRLMTEYTQSNSSAGVYMNIPNKPIRYEIRSTGGRGDFGQICAGVAMEGSVNSLYRPVGLDHTTEVTLATSGTTYAMLGIRLGTGPSYIGASGYLSDLSILSTTGDNYVATIQIAPTLNKPSSWERIPNTPIQISDIDNSLIVGATGFVIATYIGKGSALSSDVISLRDNAFSLGYKIDGTPQEWWVCIKPLSGNAKYRVSGNTLYFV
jgi:hypothetical protein